jgi:nitroreductase
MDFFELIQKRYSVRSYRPDPVEGEKLQRVLEAARLAPTACNKQPIQFVVMSTQGKHEELKRVYKADWFADAPLIICGCAKPDDAWVRWDGKNYGDVDITIAMDHLILAATDQGLGTCWIGAFNPDAAREVFGLSSGEVPVALTPLGYAADEPREKTRKCLDELVRRV